MLAHQPRYAIPAYPHAPDAQRPLNSRTAVRPMAIRVHPLDASEQLRVPLTTLARAALAPSVVPTAGNLVESAHHRDRVLRAVCFEELEDFCLRSEENRMAFFRIACSS